MQDGKLVRYIVHADRRIARLHESTGRGAEAPTTLGGDTSHGGDIVAIRDRDVMGLLRWLAVLATLGGVLLGGLLHGARSRPRPLAWVAALGPRAASALGVLVLAVSAASLTSCSGAATSGAPPPIEEGTIRGLTDADTLLFHDQLGSLLTETSGTGEVRARFAAYPYGATRHQSATESRLYAGAPRDTGVGLDHMGARFYAHDLAAWTIPDPVLVNSPELVATADFATANPYAYANLNPVVAVDSDGNFPHVLAGAIGGFLVGGGVEMARQYMTQGEIKDWGRIGAAATGGAVAGAISFAVPGAGLATVMSVGAGSTAAAGLTERILVSGGKDAGTLTDVAIDAGVGAVTAGLLKGGSALVKRMFRAKPATVPAQTASSQTNPLAGLTDAEIDAAVNAQLRTGPMLRAPAPTGARFNTGGGMMVNEHTVQAASSAPGASGNVATRIRIHTADPKAPVGSNSAAGNTVTITQGGGARRLIPGAGWIRTSSATDAQMNASHIRIHE